MIIQKIIGGLGNQMFQYAYIKALSLRTGQDYTIDLHEFQTYKLHKYCLEVFNIEKKYTKEQDLPRYEQFRSTNKYVNYGLIQFKRLCKKINPRHYVEKQFNFDPDFLNISSGYIEGYFQTEKYFIDFEDEIRAGFQFVVAPSQRNQETLDIINSCTSVSIHIRRGDYLKGNNPNYHGICGLDYYHQAVKHIQSQMKNPIFFIFSDDIERVKDNLKIDTAHYIDRNTAETNYEDMRLMSQCKHNIIANSSFSWRGAWLNTNPDKIVIAPKRRFATNKLNHKDIVPENWIKF